ncbi:PiggyBac transposable element-derived protein 3 [Eumeta japonica]|uniref:PiggyBac transposable element-derived protein 3 n=1 Tax=Eumeta variegata TaxID=151549 RepID=A0A4C1VHP6_EUMVA|nr:PiggyBac transposable element-derived protein 3 [Eumeta japonica]
MATFLDPVTRRRVPLNNDIILGILQDGNCSDIDFHEPDEEFNPKTSILDDDLIIKDNDGPSEAPATPSLPPGVPHPKTSVLKRKSIDMYTKANQGESSKSCSKKSKRIPAAKPQVVASKKKPPKTKLPPRKRIWKKNYYIDKQHDYPTLPEPLEIRTPTQYYSDYFTEDLYELIALCTNLYYLRKKGRVLNTTKQEIKRLIGIHLLMGILSYPRMVMYWRRNISISMISSAMTRDRLMALRTNLHVVESDSPPASDSNNPLWKVQPIIDAVREGCTKILRTPGRYSIDEQMIPFTGRCHLKQYVKTSLGLWVSKILW